MKIFENIHEQRLKKDKKIKFPFQNLRIEPNKKFRSDHNQEILKFRTTQENQHPLDRQNYGISFQVPEFLALETIPQRFHDRLIVDKLVKIPQSGENQKTQSLMGLSLLEKRSFSKFDQTNQNADTLEKQDQKESKKSFFGSQDSTIKSEDFLITRLLVRSLEEKQGLLQRKSLMIFPANSNASLSFDRSERKVFRSELNVKQNEMKDLRRWIQMMDLKEDCNRKFKGKVIELCDYVLKGYKKRK